MCWSYVFLTETCWASSDLSVTFPPRWCPDSGLGLAGRPGKPQWSATFWVGSRRRSRRFWKRFWSRALICSSPSCPSRTRSLPPHQQGADEQRSTGSRRRTLQLLSELSVMQPVKMAAWLQEEKIHKVWTSEQRGETSVEHLFPLTNSYKLCLLLL